MATEKRFQVTVASTTVGEWSLTPGRYLSEPGNFDPSLQMGYLQEISSELKKLNANGRASIASTPMAQVVDTTVPHDGPLLSELFKLYTDFQLTSKRWRPKTQLENTAIIHLLIRVTGDLPITRYDRQTMVNFMKITQCLPKNHNKDPRFRDRRIPEILKMRDVQPMNPRTINKYLERIRAFFTWCRDSEYVERNCAERLSIKVDGHPRDERDALSDDDLTALLRGSVYCGKRAMPHYRFWLPLLGMFTGARLDELCQLHTADIQKCNDVWCISFNNDGRKKFKNASSMRTIPIHSHLIELGFLNFIELKRKRNDTRLFMELPWKELDGYMRNASKWFSEYRKSCGVDSRKKTFHSFRHTVLNRLKQEGCPEEQASALVGHATDSITFGRYGKEYRPEVLVPVVEKLNYKVDCSHLIDPGNNPYLRLV